MSQMPIQQAIQTATRLAAMTKDPLFASAIAYLAPLLADPDPLLEHPQTRQVLDFVARAEDAYLALYGKPLP